MWSHHPVTYHKQQELLQLQDLNEQSKQETGSKWRGGKQENWAPRTASEMLTPDGKWIVMLTENSSDQHCSVSVSRRGFTTLFSTKLTWKTIDSSLLYAQFL